ncbi:MULTISPECIES: hypothetical protein [Brevibacillus]|uniref:hypothetical protein n=1 Tax=Brevibacillus TaxID=55080 RepID=UPI00364016BF
MSDAMGSFKYKAFDIEDIYSQDGELEKLQENLSQIMKQRYNLFKHGYDKDTISDMIRKYFR